MSRIKELKVKYPALAVSVIDLLAMVDPTSNNKYLGLLSQLIHNRIASRLEHESIEEFQRIAIRNGYPEAIANDTPPEQLYLMYILDGIIDPDTIRAMNEFMDLNERRLIEQNDILKYNTIQEIQDAISSAHIKAVDKTMAGEIIRIHEDDEWLILRPLTFAASCKYGASTKWCTTAVNEPHHFYRYWHRGALIYILNKKTGYKVATQKFYDNTERSTLWNAVDHEINWADIDVPAWVFTIVKNEIDKKVTNESFCSSELATKVRIECGIEPVADVRRYTVNFNPGEIAAQPNNQIQQDINNNLLEALTRAINGGLFREQDMDVTEEVQAAEPQPIQEPQPVQEYRHYEQSVEERNNPLLYDPQIDNLRRW